MLNRSKLLKEVEEHAHELFYDFFNELTILRKTWDIILNDPLFQEKLPRSQKELLVPTWPEAIDLSTQYKIVPEQGDYTVIGVDGSQVYPDRHQGTTSFLINIGAVVMRYGEHATVAFKNEPFLKTKIPDSFFPAEYVDALREEYELHMGQGLIDAYQHHDNLYLLLDGSLIFWHLMGQDKRFVDCFLPRYLKLFDQWGQQQRLFASYTSLPRNCELINLVALKVADFNPALKEAYACFDELHDVHVLDGWLKEFHRTIVFKNHSAIAELYPAHVHPHFFYLHSGSEIARVEIPAYIAEQPALVDKIAAMVLSQVLKGLGYPLILAEAHEQAVVKTADKEFFYDAIHRLGMKRNLLFKESQKNQKKRRMAV